MILFLRDLLQFGRCLENKAVTPIKCAYSLDIESGAIEAIKATHELPGLRDRTTAIRPNHGYDHPSYVVFGKQKRGLAFWDQVLDDLRAAKDTKLVQLASSCMDKVICAKMTVSDGDVSIFGHKIKEADWVVLTYRGEPITKRPAFRTWWEKSYRSSQEEVGKPTHTDLLSLEPCVPVTNHPVIRSGGVQSSFVSFSEPIYMKRELNGITDTDGVIDGFPVSANTSALYSRGFKHALDNWSTQLGFVSKKAKKDSHKTRIMAFPIEGPSEPILDLFAIIMGRMISQEDADKLWADVEAIEPTQNPLRVAVLRHSKGRLALLRYGATTVADMRAAMLRFRQDFSYPGHLTFRVLDVARPGEGSSSLPNSALIDAAWAVVMGEVFPFSVIQHCESTSDPQYNRICAAWATAYSRRKEPHLIMNETARVPRNLNREIDHSVIDKDGKIDLSKIPSPEEVPANLDHLYNLGRYAAMISYASYYDALVLKKLRSQEAEKRLVPYEHVDRLIRSPRLFFATVVASIDRHRENPFRSPILATFFAELQDVELKIGLDVPRFINSDGCHRVRAGFTAQLVWCQKLRDFWWMVARAKAALRAAKEAEKAARLANEPVAAE